jgi:hypothetical protein
MSRPGAEKVNVALVLSVVNGGADWISTAGAVPSTFQLYSAGVGSTLPAASFARTAKSCPPNARLL